MQDTGQDILEQTATKTNIQRRMDSANETLQKVKTDVSLAKEQLDKKTFKDAAKVGKNLIEKGKNLGNEAAALDKSVIQTLSQNQTPNAYSEAILSSNMAQIRGDFSTVSGKKEAKDAVLKELNSQFNNIKKAPDQATAWSMLLELRSNLGDIFRGTNEPRIRKLQAQTRDVINDMLYKEGAGGIPEAEVARAVYMASYDAKNTGAKLLRQSPTGRELITDPKKAKSLLANEEATDVVGKVVDEADAPVIRQAAEVAQQTPTQKRMLVEQAEPVTSAKQGVKTAKEEKLSLKQQEAEKLAGKADARISLAEDKLDEAVSRKVRDVTEGTQDKLQSIFTKQKQREIDDAVAAIRRGVSPTEEGMKALKNNTNLTDTDIQAVIDKNVTIKKGGTGFQAMQDVEKVDPKIRGTVITPEDWTKAMRAAEISVDENMRNKAAAIVNNNTSKSVDEKLTMLGKLIGVAASWKTRIPLLGSVITKELDKAMKSNKAIDVVSHVATVLKIAEEKGLDLNNLKDKKVVIDKIMEGIEKYGGRDTLRSFAKQRAKAEEKKGQSSKVDDAVFKRYLDSRSEEKSKK